MSTLAILICERKPKFQWKFLFFHINLFYGWHHQAPMMKEKRNCFYLFKKINFFYSPSNGNKYETPTAIQKCTHPVEGTPPGDKSFSVKWFVFVNLKFYVEFNSNIFTIKRNLVLRPSKIHLLLDFKTSLYFVMFYVMKVDYFFLRTKLETFIILN